MKRHFYTCFSLIEKVLIVTGSKADCFSSVLKYYFPKENKQKTHMHVHILTYSYTSPNMYKLWSIGIMTESYIKTFYSFFLTWGKE